MKDKVIGLASLALIAMQNRNKGGRSVTYDFSMLDESEFKARPLARYKKKFPRYRVMPKLMKGFDLHVFWLPPGMPSYVDEFAEYKNFDQFLQEAFVKPVNRYDILPGNRHLNLSGQNKAIVSAIQKVAQNPNSKILIIETDQPEQLTPILMLHDLSEAVVGVAHQKRRNVTIGLYGEMYSDKMKNPYEYEYRKDASKYFVQITNPEYPNDPLYRIPALPKTPNLEKMLKKGFIGDYYWATYGVSNTEQYNDKEMISDAFAQKMATGKLEWLTVDNSPAFRAFYERQFEGSTIVFPESLKPFENAVEQVINRILKIVGESQIFYIHQ